MNLFYLPEISDEHLLLDEEESHHVLKVLRLDVGAELPVTDGKGNIYFCKIESIGKTCSLSILKKESHAKPAHNIHIAIAPTKSSDRTEWFVEKATEMGIQEITFIQAQRSERVRVNTERMQRVAISAMKQSGQVWLPKINNLVEYKTVIKAEADQKFIAYVDANNPPQHLIKQATRGKQYFVLIGPEGDFSPVEISDATKNGFSPISLGGSTLRTETAALAACHSLNLIQLL